MNYVISATNSNGAPSASLFSGSTQNPTGTPVFSSIPSAYTSIVDSTLMFFPPYSMKTTTIVIAVTLYGTDGHSQTTGYLTLYVTNSVPQLDAGFTVVD